jgi:hypothetical protein
MPRKKSKKTSAKTKDQLARDLQSGMLNNSPAKNLERNTEFAGQMSTTIGSMIENLTIENEVDFSDEQKKIFQDMLETLKKIATSEGNTNKDQEDLRMMLAQLVVQSEIQTKKIEKDVVEKDKQIEINEEEVRYLKQWQEKAEKDTTISEKEKESINKELILREKELEIAKSEKERLTKNLETQKKLGEDARASMQAPTEKRMTLKDAFKADITSGMRDLAPGLDWRPEEGQSYRDMLKGNFKSMTSIDGFKKAFGSKLIKSEKDIPTNEQLIEAARVEAQQEAQIESREPSIADGVEAVTEAADVAPASTNNDAILSSLLQEVTVIRKLVEGSVTRDKGGMYRDADTGTYANKEMLRTAGTGLFSKDELNQQLELSPSKLKKTSLKDMEKMAASAGRISPLAQNTSAANDDDVVDGSIAAPTEILEQLQEQGKINNDILKSLLEISENTRKSAEFLEEADRENDAQQSTLTNDEISGGVSPEEKSLAPAALSKPEDINDESAGSSGSRGGIADMAMNMLGGRRSKGGVGRGMLGRGAGKAAGGVAGSVAGTAAKTGSGAAAKAAGKTVGKIGAKAAGKSLLKKIPGIGIVAGLGFGAGRLMSGDWKGALGEVASGAASTIPGLGTAASVAIDAGLAARDVSNANQLEGGIEGAPTPIAGMLDDATSNAAPPVVPRSSGGGANTIINNITTPSEETTSQGTTSVRIQDNSFIRFQDKRVARV